MSHTLDIQHFVFGTLHRENTINFENREALYRFIWKKLKELKCHLYRINGMSDHVHIVVDVHPSISKAKLMQYLKTSSSHWMSQSGLFPNFCGWCSGYFSESKDPESLDRIVNYVRNQETHHLGEDYIGEVKRLYNANGLDWDDRDML